MWICVRAIDRDIQYVSEADTKEDILDEMYDDMCEEFANGNDLLPSTDEIDMDDGNYFSEMRVSADYKGKQYDWKCLWI